MRVEYTWQDAGSYDYSITAEVPESGRGNIQIVEIVTHDGITLDFRDDNDFTDDERRDILWLAKCAGDELLNSEDPPLDGDMEDEDEDLRDG